MGSRGSACLYPCLYQLPDSHMPMRQTSSLTNHSRETSHAQVGFCGLLQLWCAAGDTQHPPPTNTIQPAMHKHFSWCHARGLVGEVSHIHPKCCRPTRHTQGQEHTKKHLRLWYNKWICLQNPVNNPQQAQYVCMLYMHNPT